MDSASYGDKIAESYDEKYPTASPGEVDFLVEEAGSGPVLELGIGTGRIAIPLKEKGIDICGIEISPKMVNCLKAKPAGRDIPVSIGDFVKIPDTLRYSMIFAVFNTFFGLTTREEQIQCFQSIYNSLLPGGRFVMQSMIPDFSAFFDNQVFSVLSVKVDEVVLSASKIDPIGQTMMAQKIKITEDGIKLFPTEMRYALPSELDLMAEAAGFKLASRYGGWDRREFKAGASAHVSVYKKPEK